MRLNLGSVLSAEPVLGSDSCTSQPCAQRCKLRVTKDISQPLTVAQELNLVSSLMPHSWQIAQQSLS